MKDKIILAIVILICASCSCKSSPYKDLNDEFLKYPEVELSTFSISGTATCDTCKRSEVTALQVEVVPVGDPLTTLSMNVFDGLGTFYFSDLRYKKDARLTVYGRLYLGGSEIGMSSAKEITVPSNDGDIVSLVLNFPSQSD